jgi:hypothetical protein
MWSTEYDTKCVWGTIIKNQHGGNGKQKTGHLTTTEIAVKGATWKSLLDNLYLDSATRDLKGEDEAYKFASRNDLGGLLVFTHLFNLETRAFAQDPCFVVIALPSTGLDDPALTLMSDKVWGDAKLVHLLGLPVTDMGYNPLRPVCGMVGIEYLSGLFPIPIREAILRTPLVWCMNGDVVFSVGFAPNKTSVDNEIMGWLSVNDPKETDCHREITPPPPRSRRKRRTREPSTSYQWLCLFLSTTACPSATPSAARSRAKNDRSMEFFHRRR